MNTPVEEQNKEAPSVEPSQASSEANEASVKDTPGSAQEKPIEDHATTAAQAAMPSAADREPNPLLKSLPLLLSLGALLLASYAFFIAQQGASEQQAQIQSLAMRMGGLESQTNTLQSNVDKMGNMAANQRDVIVHNELSTIAGSLQKIAPLAQGEQQILIQQMQQLLVDKSGME